MRNNHRAAWERDQGVFQSAQSFNVQIVGRFVEQQNIAAGFQDLREVHSVAFSAGEFADHLSLLDALEIEAADIAARGSLIVADLDEIEAARDLLPDRVLVVQSLPRLIHIGEFDAGSQANFAAIGFLDAGEHAEQGGLAGPVRPDDADDAAGRQAKTQGVDQQPIVVTFSQVLAFDDQIPQALARGNVDLVGLVALLKFLRGQLFIALQPRFGFGLTRFRVGSHPFQFAFQGFRQRVLLPLFLSQALSFLLQPRGVVALPGNAVAAIEFQDPLGHVVEKIAIVRHSDHRARIFLQKVLQPGHRFGIQVIGRLIEQQHVRLGQKQPAQGDAPLLAARQLADHGIPRRQTQRIRRDLELALQFPAADRVDFVLHLRLLLHELVHFIVRHRLGELIADRVEAIDQALYIADSLADHLANGLAFIQQRLLRQITDFDSGLRARFALDVLVDAGHDFQQRGFSGAVQSQHADLRAGEKTQTDIAQNNALGRHDLANPVHGVNELSHLLPVLN